MDGHAKLSASGAARWLACPGSIRLCAGIPTKSSSYADEGTAAHEVGEWCLRKDLDAIHLCGEVIKVNGKNRGVTIDMVEAVQLYLDTVRADLASTVGGSLAIEQKFGLGWLGREDIYGRNDASISQPFGLLRVYDYKHGKGHAVDVVKKRNVVSGFFMDAGDVSLDGPFQDFVTESDTSGICIQVPDVSHAPVPIVKEEIFPNPQMMFYALGAAGLEPYEEVELVIVQPRAQHHDGPVRRFRMPIEHLLAWGREVLLPGALRTEDPAAPLCSGDHCRDTFCPAMPTCPALRQVAISVAKTAFDEIPALPLPEALTPANLREILERGSLIEDWIAACREHVKAGLADGSFSPAVVGHKLIEGRASRSWKDDALVEKWLSSQLGPAAFSKKLLSPAQAEKALGKEAKKAVAALVRESRGVQMARIDDPRPEISKTAALAFDEVSFE